MEEQSRGVPWTIYFPHPGPHNLRDELAWLLTPKFWSVIWCPPLHFLCHIQFYKPISDQSYLSCPPNWITHKLWHSTGKAKPPPPSWLWRGEKFIPSPPKVPEPAAATPFMSTWVTCLYQSCRNSHQSPSLHNRKFWNLPLETDAYSWISMAIN